VAELLTNGDFEAWAAGLPTGWEKLGTQTIAEEKVDVHTGTKAVKGTTTGPGCGIKQTVAGVAANQRLRLQVFQHVDAAAVAADYRVCVELQIVGGELGGLFLNFSTGEWEAETPANEKNLQLLTRPISTRYVQLGYEFSAPPIGTSIRFTLKRVDGNPYSFWFDSASLATVAVPATPTSIDWGEYAHHIPNEPAVLDGIISEFGRPDYVGMYREWGGDILTPADIRTLDARGIIPTISWETDEETHKPTLAEIAAGAADAYIDAQAAIIAAYGKPVIIRPFWEMNLSWMFGERVAPDTYVAGWRYLVERMKAKGATNALWFWCPSIDYDRGEGTKFETIHDFFPYFPGDAYVDFVGADGYSSAFYNTELKKAGWATVEEIFFYTYHCLAGLSTKPFIIGETGVEEEGGDKPNWIREGMLETIPQVFPRIDAIFYFNRHNEGEPEWELDSTPAAHDAFKEAVLSGLYVNESIALPSGQAIRPGFGGRVPKLRIPLRLENGRLGICEQDSQENVAAAVYAILAYERGSRIEDPEFGVEDPTFDTMPLDVDEWLEQIGRYEPRAEVRTSQEVGDLIGAVLVNVGLGP
jgi:phage baseplate assembly protein W